MTEEQTEQPTKEPEQGSGHESIDPEQLIKDESSEAQAERYALVQKILSKETFIDPLDAEMVTKAYALYGTNPQKIVDVIVDKLRYYSRKCIREAALLDVKNELSQLPLNEAEHLKEKVVNELYQKIQKDPILEQLIVMLIFKNRFWEWIRYGLKEILNEKRSEPGHEINTVLNRRFHLLKKEKNIKIVGDLVLMDVTEIVNRFKREVMKKSVKIF